MADDWQTTTLGAVVGFQSGGTPSKSIDAYWNGTIPWVSAKDMKQLFLDDTEDHITDSAIKDGAKVVPEGTVLLLTRGMTLLSDVPICLVRRSMSFNQDVRALRPNGDVRTEFLPYLLLGNKHRLLGMVDLAGHGTGRLNTSELKSLDLLLPGLAEQQAIACILAALDDKIELNRRTNRTLESIARAIFKSWFVNFDPVRANAAGQQPRGLASHLAALFPDAFESSDLGEIPKGWRARPLSDVLQINPSRLLTKGTLAPYLDMANMPTQGPSPDDWAMREAGSGMKFVKGDTLVARITPCLENGKTAFVDFLNDGQVGWGSTEYIVLRPQLSIPLEFAYLLARSDEFRAFAIQRMTGSSGRQRVPVDSLAKFAIACPESNSPIFQKLGDIVSPMFDRISASMKQSRALAALRDTLLPKLISGELRVPDAERIVGRYT
jgi:type I restriction enzyme S subunit